MTSLSICLALPLLMQHPDALPVLELTADDTLVGESARVVIPPGTVLRDEAGDGVLRVVADDVRLVFEPGSVLAGAEPGAALDSLSGVGVRVEGHSGVRIEGLVVRGYKVGVWATAADGLSLDRVDASDNFAQRLRSTPERCDDGADWLACHDNDANEWLSRYGAGLYVEESSGVVVRSSRVRGTQNGLLLDSVEGAEVYDNDFSFLSGWGLGLWRSSDNVISHNALDFCIRGYSHGVYNRGQDSAGILVFEQCSRNVFAYNYATHGGDGVFGFAGSEALGQREVLPRGFDATRRGSNDNIFVGNDFSYAAAHGLEMTFSFGNVVEDNRFAGNAICGIWGGYSRGMLVRGNAFTENGDAGYGSERGGVNIEHSFENWVVGNRFERNACGVHLWWDEDTQLLETPWAGANETACAENAVFGNSFIGDAVGLELRACKPVVASGNEFVSVRVELEAPAGSTVDGPLPQLPGPLGSLEVPGRRRPVGARSELVGREKIVMGEWGPWDHESPFVQLVERGPGRHVYALHGHDPEAVSLEGEGVTLELSSGSPPRAIVRAAGAGLFSYELAVGGERRRDVIQQLSWEISCFALESDPREDEAAWRAASAQVVPEVRAELDLPFASGGPRDLGFDPESGIGRDHFGTLARADVPLPAGRYQLRCLSDDGVRVWVDEELLIDNWTWHAPQEDVAELELSEARVVRLRVEHFELDGYSVLQLELVPLAR